MSEKIKGYKISIRLDIRRKKETQKYPVKLRVYGKQTQIEKWYALDIDLTEKQFDTIWTNPDNKNLRGSNNETRLKLQAIETRANKEAEQMTVFDFAKFEAKLFRKSTDQSNVKYHFDLVIQKNLKNNKIGTAESYKYTLNSLADFSENQKKCNIEKLSFNTITVDWLNEYQNFMLSNGKSYTTIAIYTRTLRAVFNNAIESNDIIKDIYPFGEKKFKIPQTRKVKKALNAEQLKTLFNAEVTNENEQQAKDFWFFSYACNGMNLKDISLLKYSDIKEDRFNYYRAKTFDKTAKKTAITIHLTEYTKSIISKYGNENKDGFVFSIIALEDSSQTQYNKIKNFTRLINDHIKRIAKANDLPADISTYWARHSFATQSIRSGVSMEFISEALNHSDLSVTKNYFAGFEDEAKKEFANNLMNF
ncbi:site-specific integrase [Mariniflexile litorale]|uniref:Site-specific integrase n=1 Tax=Mariniflexile litorale TaxID=3045158 RepID=A0AAU7EK28_9FLAO|nr:site-specific integrase [Mariniflexile sp. KMM 9835]MDQ8211223.1 site-specific integrase [Mariniflexile sp. KMM 9835]